jgi:hypothetical protein
MRRVEILAIVIVFASLFGFFLVAPHPSALAKPHPPVECSLEIYDARDLLGTPAVRGLLTAEALESAIKARTGGDEAWAEPASYELHRGQIIVNQTRTVHDEVRHALSDFRRQVPHAVR